MWLLDIFTDKIELTKGMDIISEDNYFINFRKWINFITKNQNSSHFSIEAYRRQLHRNFWFQDFFYIINLKGRVFVHLLLPSLVWLSSLSYMGFKGIRQWPINWCRSSIMIPPSLDSKYCLKRLNTQLNEPIN